MASCIQGVITMKVYDQPAMPQFSDGSSLDFDQRILKSNVFLGIEKLV